MISKNNDSDSPPTGREEGEQSHQHIANMTTLAINKQMKEKVDTVIDLIEKAYQATDNAEMLKEVDELFAIIQEST